MKRIFAIIPILLLLVVSLHAATLTGTIRRADGSRFNGKIRLTLSHPARDTGGNSVIVPQTVEFRVVNGALPSGAAVSGNDVLEPLYTYYWTEYFDAYGSLVMQNPFYIAGGSFDLGAARPTTITTANIGFIGVPKVGTCPAGQFATGTTTSGVICEAIDVATDVSGNLSVTHLNGGTNASATTYWRGDGAWASPFLSATATLDFPSTPTLTSSDLTVTVTGAAVGDAVAIGIPAPPDTNACFTAFVSAADVVTVRFNNYSSGAIDPASGSYKVTVIK